MSLLTIIIIAISLSIDACAVSITNGCVIRSNRNRHALIYALSFGFFQGVMPVVGWFAGREFFSYIANYAHWIAFALLTYIGIKMIHDAHASECETDECALQSMKTVMILSIATSIDALAAGVTFAMVDVTILTPVLIIGCITFILSYIAFFLGERLSCYFGSKAEAVGGGVLILIGLKVVAEHYLIV